MAVEYDDKIVRMQFDNKGFESGVRNTLSSLEELKASLKFSNVTTGIDQVGASIKNLSFDNLTTGIENNSKNTSNGHCHGSNNKKHD